MTKDLEMGRLSWIMKVGPQIFMKEGFTTEGDLMTLARRDLKIQLLALKMEGEATS